MLVRTFRNAVLALLITLPISVSSALGVEIDALAATPVGSWTIAETLMTDHRGRQNVIVVKHSMLGTEQRNGQTLYWVESVIDMFELKNGERKQLEERLVLKALVGEAFFKGDPENLSIDLKSSYIELIVQAGEGEPMRMPGIGGMLEGVLDSFGAEITMTFESVGFEAVTVPAGTFHTEKILGSGTTTSGFGESTTSHTIWYTQSVPFGAVKSEVRTTDNGEVSTHTTQLLDYGTSGALSLITSPPQELPPMPGLPALFGG